MAIFVDETSKYATDNWLNLTFKFTCKIAGKHLTLNDSDMSVNLRDGHETFQAETETYRQWHFVWDET